MKGITTIASLPGSGSGSMSALPVEVGKAKPSAIVGELAGVYSSCAARCEPKWTKPLNFGGYPAIPVKSERDNHWTVTRSVFEVEDALKAGLAVENLGPAMWKITPPADLLDVSGGGE